MKKKKKNKKDFPLEIFNEFLKHEKEFKDMMGYGADEIRQIGVHKFIKAMGWDSKEQVTSWKTDKAHMKPCDECGGWPRPYADRQLHHPLCQRVSPRWRPLPHDDHDAGGQMSAVEIRLKLRHIKGGHQIAEI